MPLSCNETATFLDYLYFKDLALNELKMHANLALIYPIVVFIGFLWVLGMLLLIIGIALVLGVFIRICVEVFMAIQTKQYKRLLFAPVFASFSRCMTKACISATERRANNPRRAEQRRIPPEPAAGYIQPQDFANFYIQPYSESASSADIALSSTPLRDSETPPPSYNSVMASRTYVPQNSS
ncbi:uncharacterized protein NEMAJ01_0068 [Nematocida major]|uniref:uncharacterized protein n=1 Tax=Nematocida major TaxID=1912982 RepID=UPI002008DFE8|nr:uncharacterized protein NEMAJ01_0068 [Nematocida major]KAH9385172.1 hypothetical protein NEMAJ01_0068 [Nematocida major]